MGNPGILLLEGFLFALLFGGLSLLRRENLSARFAMEAVIVTVFFAGLAALTEIQIHPVLFLIIIYLITMRVRLLVDIANGLARSRKYASAESVYALAERMWPDQTGLLILHVNWATARLQSGDLEGAITAFRNILQKAGLGYLGVKYETAAHYNLGVAYSRKGMEPQAMQEFNAVLDTWPASEYARRASDALARASKK